MSCIMDKNIKLQRKQCILDERETEREEESKKASTLKHRPKLAGRIPGRIGSVSGHWPLVVRERKSERETSRRSIFAKNK